MLSAILSTIGGPLIRAFIDPFVDLVKQHMAGQITKAELEQKTQALLIEKSAAVEISHSETLAKTYASFMEQLGKSRLIQIAWATVLFSQLGVVLWHQFGISAVIAMGLVDKWPSSGSTVDWAYALVGGCIGLAPLVLRTSAVKLK